MIFLYNTNNDWRVYDDDLMDSLPDHGFIQRISYNSIACFYGCFSSTFADIFLDYKTNVIYTAGIESKAGGSKTYKGELSRSIIPPHFFSEVYMVDIDENAIVQKKEVFKRGVKERGSSPSEIYVRVHQDNVAERIYGNITVKKGKAINGSKELNP